MRLMARILWSLISALLQQTAGARREVAPNARVDCAPRLGDSNRDFCLKHQCIWDGYCGSKPNASESITVPLCYFPSDTGYMLKNLTTNGSIVLERAVESGGHNPYGDDLTDLRLTYSPLIADSSLLPVSIGAEGRFVPPVPLNSLFNEKGEEEVLTFRYQTAPVFSFTVERVSDGTKLWDTSIGGLLFADQYIQIATYLASDRLYDVGENVHQRLKDDMPDALTEDNTLNYYGMQPFYLAMEPSGKAHGVLILNSNAQEFTTSPAPHLVYRTIGGQLDIYFMAGPTAEQVVQQYQQLVGRPVLPPYWALGYQFCRYGYSSLEEVKEIVGRIEQAKISIDVVMLDINYMDRYRDFTYDSNGKWSELPRYADELHRRGMHLVLIFDPFISVTHASFERARLRNTSFVEWPLGFSQILWDIHKRYPLVANTSIMLGVGWPDAHVAFPDFFDPETARWWVDELVFFHGEVPFDGIWLDMNEPAAMGTNQERPKYFDNPDHPDLEPLMCPTNSAEAGDELNAQTNCYKSCCMMGRTMRGSNTLYNTRGLYGWAQTRATNEVMHKIGNGKRGIIITRSNFPGSGQHAGHWLGDNFASWADLKEAVIGAQEFNLFGIPYVGSDVCGFRGATNEELCLRWQQLGITTTTTSLRRILHSVAIASKAANTFRYRYLPYLYSLHCRASLYGGTVIRPVLFEFPLDGQTHTLGYQFMWGQALMILSVIEPNISIVRGYLPPASKWYSVSDEVIDYGKRVESGGYLDVPAPRTALLPTFLRAGYAVPRQRPELTAAGTRRNALDLLIALAEEEEGSAFRSQGELYWEDGDGDSIDWLQTVNRFSFTMVVTKDAGLAARLVINRTLSSQTPQGDLLLGLEALDLLGYPFAINKQPQNFRLNGNAIGGPKSSTHISCQEDRTNGWLRIEIKPPINLGGGLMTQTVEWQDAPDTNLPESAIDPIADPEKPMVSARGEGPSNTDSAVWNGGAQWHSLYFLLSLFMASALTSLHL